MGGFSMNNRRKFIQQLALGTAGVMAAQFPKSLYAASDFVKISIMHTNDMHCHIDPFPANDKRNAGKGGMARLGSIIDRQRAENPNTLLFDAGDMFQGTPYFNYYKGELMLKVMSKVGYDAGTLGNHEFDNGLEGIKNAIPHAGFPIISSNYDFSDTILRGAFPEYKIFKKGGIKIGVYGLGIELAGLVTAKNYKATKYLDPVETALKMELFLKKDKKCDMVICLSHLGYQYKNHSVSDKVVAETVSYTDLIIGGHTHTFMKEPMATTNARGKKTVVNQVGFGALLVGHLDFVFDKTKKNKLVFSANRSNG